MPGVVDEAAGVPSRDRGGAFDVGYAGWSAQMRFELIERGDGRGPGPCGLILVPAGEVRCNTDATGSPGKTSDASDVSEVRIVQFVPGERLVWEVDFESEDPSFQGTMQMEWTLRDVGEGTDVEIVARDVPAGIRAADHAAGLTSSLANLAAYLEP